MISKTIKLTKKITITNIIYLYSIEIINASINTTINQAKSTANPIQSGNQTQNQVSQLKFGLLALHSFKTKNTIHVIMPIVLKLISPLTIVFGELSKIEKTKQYKKEWKL